MIAMENIIRVLVVDDSAFVRKVIKQMLLRSPFIEVVGVARDGLEALELAAELKPDVITLDLNMPGLDGVAFLRAQMARRPVPVVVVSIASRAGNMVLSAMEAGAVEVVRKPTALANEQVMEIADDLIAKVKIAAQACLAAQPAPSAVMSARAAARRAAVVDALVIGISTGGPQALKAMIPRLPADFPVPIAIVLHMPVGFTELYAKSLAQVARIEVAEAQAGDVLRPGLALLAPAGQHMRLLRRADGAVAVGLGLSPADTPHRPSVDVLFRSAAEVFGARVLGVVMTGMGNDGLQGAAWIKAHGGRVLTEDETSCVIYGMPRAVVEAGLSDRAVPLAGLADAILEAV